MRNVFLRVTCPLALLMPAVTAWPQSSAGFGHQLAPMAPRNPAEIMKQLSEASANGIATQAASVPSSSYTFSAVDFPGVAFSEAYDTFNGLIIGDFQDDANFFLTTAFTMRANVGALYTIPGFNGTPALFAINTSGEMVGGLAVPQIGIRSFEIINGEATVFDPPQSALLDEATGVNVNGTIVGIYFDTNNALHGYIYRGGRFTAINYPGAQNTFAYDINMAGEIVGCWTDLTDTSHGYFRKGGTFTDIEVPQAMSTCARAIDDKGDIAGSYVDANKMTHGFRYRNGVFQTIDVARATMTSINCLKNSGELIGTYGDDKGGSHGFTAH
ncbi:MAG TPA: hypothetical protein VFE61_06035 [Candidatus Sulfotelmatobacter sp.]|nr:hypothetical protein [Candidatus Sulfotelmatobacter sp.]